MNREDLLFEYFEGGLEVQDEELLFHQLNFDSTLREEFNQQMRILMLTKQDSGFVSAPLESTEAIFSRLGINSHYYFAARRKELFFNFLKSPALKRTLSIAAIAFFAFMSSLIVYDQGKQLFYGESEISSKLKYRSGIPVVSSSEVNYINRYYSHNPEDSFLAYSAGIAISNNNIQDYIENEVASRNKIFARNFERKFNILTSQSTQSEGNLNDFSVETDNFNDSNQNLITPVFNISSTKLSVNDFGKSKFFDYDSKKRIDEIRSRYAKLESPDNTTIANLINDLLPRKYKLELSYKMSNLNYSSPKLNSQIFEPSSNNFEFGVGYKVSRLNQIGIIFGRDNFPQSFMHSIDGVEYKLVQNPDLYYLGISYKVLPELLFNQNYILPYVHTLISGTSVGPYLKVQSGFELNLFKRLYVFGGIENGNLIYNVDNKIYSTNKVNFVYGMNFKY